MENLIPIIEFHGQTGIQAVSARALYGYLYPADEMAHFSRWAESYITTNEFAERGQDWVVFSNPGENPLGGRPSVDYHLRLDFAKHLAMQARTEAGKRVRAYFIAVENQARLVSLQDQWGLPKTFPEALRALADKTEALEQEKAKRAQEAPLVAYAEKVQGSPSLVTVDGAAKALGIPVVAFRKFVQGKYLFSRHGEWWPYEEYGENGRKWFQMTSGTWESKGGTHVGYHTCKVTGLGQIKLKDAWERAQTMVASA